MYHVRLFAQSSDMQVRRVLIEFANFLPSIERLYYGL